MTKSFEALTTDQGMLLFDVLHLLDGHLAPERCKLHLAVWNGKEDPLDVYLAGKFDEWQQWQRNRNFKREFVISLIALPQVNKWLFAGAHNSLGSMLSEERNLFHYRLQRRDGPNELDGRLILHFERPGRQSYLLAENWKHALQVSEIRPERLCVADFPGYSWVMLTKQQLDIVVKQAVESWRIALANVAGVYVIADRKTGKLYVGSATAGEGIWSRWCMYAVTGHGGNRELKELLAREGIAYAENFQFGVLEIADTHASVEDVLRRESRWKTLLLSREHGYNAN